MKRRVVAGLLCCLAGVLPSAPAAAGETLVATAANFTAPAQEIGIAFEKASGHKAAFSFGATGQLYTQILQGAPFDAFLAADQTRPAKAVANGLAVADSRFTYAIGRIVLYSRDKTLVRGEETLKRGGFAKLALANPATAPYGAAAIETLKALQVYDQVQGKIVYGNSIAQVYGFVETGNADLGFVALSQVVDHANGSRWLVPENFYTLIAQDAVLLRHGSTNEAARAFLIFLRGPEGRAITEKYGYGTGQ